MYFEFHISTLVIMGFVCFVLGIGTATPEDNKYLDLE